MRPWSYVELTEVLEALSAYLEVEAPIRPRTLYISTIITRRHIQEERRISCVFSELRR